MRAKRKLTKDEEAVVDQKVREFVRRNLDVGITPERSEIDRTRQEAVELVLMGDLTAANLQPTKFNIEDSLFRKYETYSSPRGEA
jgi:hypothetical protein